MKQTKPIVIVLHPGQKILVIARKRHHHHK